MKPAFRREALEDVEAIAEYIRLDSPSTARIVVRRIWAATQRLARFPFSGRVGLEPGTRELVVASTPFVVVYRVLEERAPASVEIIGVFHAARDREGGSAARDVQARLR